MWKTTCLRSYFAFEHSERWSWRNSRTSFPSKTTNYARTRWMSGRLGIPWQLTSSSNSYTRYLFDFYFSACLIGLSPILIFSWLVLEGDFRCGWYCRKVVSWEYSWGSPDRSRNMGVMKNAEEKLIKTIRSRNFEKYISVAHKDNGDDFFHEVHLLSFFISDLVRFISSSVRIWHNSVFLLCRRLTVISPPSLSRIWQLKNSKRWPPHMWIRISKPSGFDGGTPQPRSRKRTNSLQLSLLRRESSRPGLTKPLFGLRCNSSFFLSLLLLLSASHL